VDGDVDAAIEERFLDFLHEHPFDVRCRRIRRPGSLVARSSKDNDLRVRALFLQQGRYGARLPERQGASSCANSDSM
jgi:hypothetical protein